jgi:hypothetical protein
VVNDARQLFREGARLVNSQRNRLTGVLVRVFDANIPALRYVDFKASARLAFKFHIQTIKISSIQPPLHPGETTGSDWIEEMKEFLMV